MQFLSPACRLLALLKHQEGQLDNQNALDLLFPVST